MEKFCEPTNATCALVPASLTSTLAWMYSEALGEYTLMCTPAEVSSRNAVDQLIELVMQTSTTTPRCAAAISASVMLVLSISSFSTSS